MPILHVVAGPNGAGKSTLTRATWLQGIEVIDPDAIMRSTMPPHRAWAAREALRRRQTALANGTSLVIETTLAGAGALRYMDAARQAGYTVFRHYVSIDSADDALMRITTRVADGGHDVPHVDVRRRFERSLDNLPLAIARADQVILYDNTDPHMPHREVAVRQGRIWRTARRIPAWAAAAVRTT